MNEIELNDTLRRQRQAQEIISNPLWDETCEALMKKAFATWASSKPHEADARDGQYQLVRALQEFRDCFKGIINSGKKALTDIEQQKELEEGEHAP